MAPMFVPESSQNPKAVCDRTHTSISSPEPSVFTMQLVAVMVSPPQSPVASLHHPLCSSPVVVDTSAVQMISDTAVTTPSPSATSIVMVATPQMPVGTHTAPATLIIPVQRAQSVTVHTYATEPAPPPLRAAMEPMVVVVLAPQMPVASHTNPTPTGPSTQCAQPVQVTADSAVSSPEPLGSPVIMISSVQTPVSSNLPPMSLVISVQYPPTVQVNTNASIATPAPSGTSVVAMVIMISAIQMPIGTHTVPSRTSPSLQDAQTVQMTANAARSAPDPTRSLVVVVASVQMPVGSHTTPVALVISIQSAKTVEVHADTPVAAPRPSMPTMETMVVMVATI